MTPLVLAMITTTIIVLISTFRDQDHLTQNYFYSERFNLSRDAEKPLLDKEYLVWYIEGKLYLSSEKNASVCSLGGNWCVLSKAVAQFDSVC